MVIHDSLNCIEPLVFWKYSLHCSARLPESSGHPKWEPPVSPSPNKVERSPKQESLTSSNPDECRWNTFGFVVLALIGILDGIKFLGAVLFEALRGCLQYLNPKFSQGVPVIFVLRSLYASARGRPSISGRSYNLQQLCAIKQLRHVWLWQSPATSPVTSGFGWSLRAQSQRIEDGFVATASTYTVSALCLARFYFSIHPCRHACLRCLGHMRMRMFGWTNSWSQPFWGTQGHFTHDRSYSICI